jgi:hypothetical protein
VPALIHDGAGAPPPASAGNPKRLLKLIGDCACKMAKLRSMLSRRAISLCYTAKNPAVGGLLNGVWPGVGNISAGQPVIGLLLMFIATVLWFWFINGMIFFFASVGGDHGWLTVLVSLITATTQMLLWVGGIV